jgi:hypothetical protein
MILGADMFAKDYHKAASNDVIMADSGPSGISLPDDVNMGKHPVSGHLHENERKEINAPKIVPSHAPEDNFSALGQAAIDDHTASTHTKSTPFEIKEGPKLEEWIPEAYLPEVLVVYDPHGVTSFGVKKPMKIYKRLYPAPVSAGESKEGDAIQEE